MDQNDFYKSAARVSSAVIGLIVTIIIFGIVFAVISLFTSLWWIGCIILFVYLWAAISLYLYDRSTNGK